MEEAKKEIVEKPVAKPKKVTPKAKAPKKATKKKAVVIQTNIARGLFLTGLLGSIFFTLLVTRNLNFLNSDIENMFANEWDLLATSVAMFLIGAFSFTKDQ